MPEPSRPKDQFSTAEQQAWFDSDVPPIPAPEPGLSKRRVALIIGGVILFLGVLFLLVVPSPTERTLPELAVTVPTPAPPPVVAAAVPPEPAPLPPPELVTPPPEPEPVVVAAKPGPPAIKLTIKKRKRIQYKASPVAQKESRKRPPLRRTGRF
jgi:hypothetical protein